MACSPRWASRRFDGAGPGVTAGQIATRTTRCVQHKMKGRNGEAEKGQAKGDSFTAQEGVHQHGAPSTGRTNVEIRAPSHLIRNGDRSNGSSARFTPSSGSAHTPRSWAGGPWPSLGAGQDPRPSGPGGNPDSPRVISTKRSTTRLKALDYPASTPHRAGSAFRPPGPCVARARMKPQELRKQMSSKRVGVTPSACPPMIRGRLGGRRTASRPSGAADFIGRPIWLTSPDLIATPPAVSCVWGVGCAPRRRR